MPNFLRVLFISVFFSRFFLRSLLLFYLPAVRPRQLVLLDYCCSSPSPPSLSTSSRSAEEEEEEDEDEERREKQQACKREDVDGKFTVERSFFLLFSLTHSLTHIHHKTPQLLFASLFTFRLKNHRLSSHFNDGLPTLFAYFVRVCNYLRFCFF